MRSPGQMNLARAAWESSSLARPRCTAAPGTNDARYARLLRTNPSKSGQTRQRDSGSPALNITERIGGKALGAFGTDSCQEQRLRLASSRRLRQRLGPGARLVRGTLSRLRCRWRGVSIAFPSPRLASVFPVPIQDRVGRHSVVASSGPAGRIDTSSTNQGREQ